MNKTLSPLAYELMIAGAKRRAKRIAKRVETTKGRARLANMAELQLMETAAVMLEGRPVDAGDFAPEQIDGIETEVRRELALAAARAWSNDQRHKMTSAALQDAAKEAVNWLSYRHHPAPDAKPDPELVSLLPL